MGGDGIFGEAEIKASGVSGGLEFPVGVPVANILVVPKGAPLLLPILSSPARGLADVHGAICFSGLVDDVVGLGPYGITRNSFLVEVGLRVRSSGLGHPEDGFPVIAIPTNVGPWDAHTPVGQYVYGS